MITISHLFVCLPTLELTTIEQQMCSSKKCFRKSTVTGNKQQHKKERGHIFFVCLATLELTTIEQLVCSAKKFNHLRQTASKNEPDHIEQLISNEKSKGTLTVVGYNNRVVYIASSESSEPKRFVQL